VSPEDVASQVWIDVARSIERFDGNEDDFRRWLFTIAHRRHVDAVRRAVQGARVRDAVADPTAAGAVAATSAVDAHAGALDEAIELVSSLPDNMAEAVMLHVVNDLSIADVAAVMGTSHGNVRVLVHRGLTRLRRKLLVTDRDRPTMKHVS
jgi:RNA polymerase sigma-70 factor (ECF subfamily)